jgi:hypothetical protein
MEEGWKEVYMTAHEYKANMAKDLLEIEGIKAVIISQHDTAYQSFGEFIVYVADEFAEKAVELLKKLKN